MSANDHEQRLHQYLLACVYTAGDLSAVDEFIALQFTLVPPDGTALIEGPGGAAALHTRLRQHFPTLAVHADELVA